MAIQQADASSPSFLAGGGEMGGRIRAFNWAATPIGASADWPQSLRSTIGLLLSTRHPMFIWWGPELIQFYNDAYRETMGPERHPGALGQRGRECWEEIWPIIGPQIDQVMAGGSVWQEEALVPVTRHGRREQVWWTYSYSPIHDEHGGVGGVLVICNDVTQGHEMTEALRVSEERLAFALESGGGVGIWDWDVQGDIVHADSRFAEFFSVQPADARKGTPIASFLQGVFADDVPEISAKIAHAVAHGGDFFAEYRVVGLDAQVRWLLVRGRCTHDGQGRALRFGGVATDTTEQHRTMEALTEANRRQTEFLATLAHELRNPLAPLRNGLQLIKLAKSQTALVEKTQAMMERQLDHLVHLVDDLLDLNRVSQGKVTLRRETVSMSNVVQQAVETVGPLLEQRKHRLTTKFPAVPVHVAGDVTRLVQIVANVLNNAAKYTDPGGEIVIAVEADGADAVVRISDSGIGIPTDMLPRVFDLFTQVDNALARAQGGLGIGLSLVAGLVKLHGGTVTASSAGEGMGSEFVIRLPLADGLAAAKASHGAVAAPRGRRILVVDDNRDAASSLTELLRMMGHSADSAFSGKEALLHGPRLLPEVVFLDIGMPELNGYDCAAEIRKQDWARGVILVALTGWGQSEDHNRSSGAGFNHHLVKPAAVEDIARILANP